MTAHAAAMAPPGRVPVIDWVTYQSSGRRAAAEPERLVLEDRRGRAT